MRCCISVAAVIRQFPTGSGHFYKYLHGRGGGECLGIGDYMMPKAVKAPVQAAEETETKPFALDFDAPFICFDNIPAFGVTNGVFNIMLASSRPTLMTDGQVPNISAVRAQLQCSAEGLHLLRSAIEQLLLLTASTKGQPS
jgi:hypothetical protein